MKAMQICLGVRTFQQCDWMWFGLNTWYLFWQTLIGCVCHSFALLHFHQAAKTQPIQSTKIKNTLIGEKADKGEYEHFIFPFSCSKQLPESSFLPSLPLGVTPQDNHKTTKSANLRCCWNRRWKKNHKCILVTRVTGMKWDNFFLLRLFYKGCAQESPPGTSSSSIRSLKDAAFACCIIHSWNFFATGSGPYQATSKFTTNMWLKKTKLHHVISQLLWLWASS